jgi:signal transduction histidine kinase
VAELVHAHRGAIDVRSTPGSGTTVTVTLPRASQDHPEA